MKKFYANFLTKKAKNTEKNKIENNKTSPAQEEISSFEIFSTSIFETDSVFISIFSTSVQNQKKLTANI